MNKTDDIDSLTKELTNFLLKAKGEITRLKNQSKQDNDFKNAVKLKFKEIQEENKKKTARAATRIREDQELGKKNKKNCKNWLY